MSMRDAASQSSRESANKMEIRFCRGFATAKTPSGERDASPSRRPSGAKAPRDKSE